MVHICHISTTFSKRSGSAQRTIEVIKECVRHGYRVSLIVGRDNDISKSKLRDVNIFCVPELVKYLSFRSDLTAPFKIIKILKQIRPDIVHTHLAKGGVLGRLSARWVRTPFILHTVHGPTFPREISFPKRFIYRSLEQFCGRFTDLFIFVGEELKKSYIEAGICSTESAVVIHTGRPDSEVDRKPLSSRRRTELCKELCGGKKSDFLIITVGRIVASKQLDQGVSILKLLRDQGIDAHLAIVGKALLDEEQQHEMDIRMLTIKQGVERNVFFAGYRTDVLDIMEAADAVLLTSRYEGLPNVAVEALIAGTPMVTYPVFGVREVLTHDTNGFIVKQNDITAASKALTHIYKHTGSKDRVRKEEFKEVLMPFRVSVMVRQKMKIYKEIFQSIKT